MARKDSSSAGWEEAGADPARTSNGSGRGRASAVAAAAGLVGDVHRFFSVGEAPLMLRQVYAELLTEMGLHVRDRLGHDLENILAPLLLAGDLCRGERHPAEWVDGSSPPERAVSLQTGSANGSVRVPRGF